MESETILPCPFCGSPAHFMEGEVGDESGDYCVWISCDSERCSYHSPLIANDDATEVDAIAMHNHVAAAVRDHAAMVAERDALRAQVAQLREPLEILWACMGLTIERFDRHLARQVAATLAATAPGEEAPR